MRSRLIFAIVFTSGILALSIIVGSSGAVPIDDWNKTFGGVRDDTTYSIQQTSDGGYILAGWTESYGAGKKDAWLIKTDANGDEQWNKTFGGKGDDAANSVRQISDGGYIIAGYTESYGVGKHDVLLIKTDIKGIEKWNMTFGEIDDDEAKSVQQTSDGGYILAGNTYLNAWLIKTNANGSHLWNRKIGYSTANSVEETIDRGYIFAGTKSIEGGGPFAAWIVKTDADGNKQWDTTFGGHADWANSILQTLDGGYVFAGIMYIPGGGLAWLLKTDAKGKQQWSRTFGGLGAEVFTVQTGAYSVQQTSDGGYILAGYKELYKPGIPNVYGLLVKTDVDGNEQWNRTFGGTYLDAAYSVQHTKDDGYILAGNTKLYGYDDSDAWLIKVGGEPADLTKKAPGFEMVLAITILVAVYASVREKVEKCKDSR